MAAFQWDEVGVHLYLDKTRTACAMSGRVVLAIYNKEPINSKYMFPGARGVPAPKASLPSSTLGCCVGQKSFCIGVSTTLPPSLTPNFSNRASILGMQLMDSCFPSRGSRFLDFCPWTVVSPRGALGFCPLDNPENPSLHQDHGC